MSKVEFPAKRFLPFATGTTGITIKAEVFQMIDRGFVIDDTDPQASGGIRFVPTIDYFQKRYGISCEGNDQKAANIFKLYEPHEKLRRFQNELNWVKQGKVEREVCDLIIGRKRRARYQSYENWARLMIMWLAKKTI